MMKVIRMRQGVANIRLIHAPGRSANYAEQSEALLKRLTMRP